MTVCYYLNQLDKTRMQQIDRWFYYKNMPRLLQAFPFFDGTGHREVWYYNSQGFLCHYDTAERQHKQLTMRINPSEKPIIVTTPGILGKASAKVFVIKNTNAFYELDENARPVSRKPLLFNNLHSAAVAISNNTIIVTGNGS